MEFLTFVLLLTFVILAYFFGGKDLLSPWFLLCLMFFATFIIVLFNYANWEVKISGLFVVYLTTAIVAFGLGVMITKRLNYKVKTDSFNCNKIGIDEANIKRKYPANIFILISLVCSAFYIWKLLSDAGDVSSFSGKIRVIYEKVVNEDYSPGSIYNQMLEIVVAIAYMNTYRLMIKINSRKDKLSYFKLLIPIILFFATVLVSSDRNIFLRFAIYFVFLYVLFFRENYKKKNANIKIVLKLIIMVFILAIIFFLLGKAKQYSSNIFNSISIYAGSGLYNFNLWIQSFDEPLLHGNSTFSVFLNSFQTVIKPFGINLEYTAVNRIDPFITYKAGNGYLYSSNIYTALKPYVEDFGYFGVILFPFIIGAFYQWLFIKMKKSKYGLSWVLYCLLIYPIIFFPILEQLCRRFHLGFMYEIVWVSILYYLIFARKKRKVAVKQKMIVGETQNEKR